MRHINWFWVSIGLFALATILCIVAAFTTATVSGYLGCCGIGLVTAGWTCQLIGQKMNQDLKEEDLVIITESSSFNI